MPAGQNGVHARSLSVELQKTLERWLGICCSLRVRMLAEKQQGRRPRSSSGPTSGSTPTKQKVHKEERSHSAFVSA